MPIAISPNFDDSIAQTLENKINIFEDQIQGWLFNPAKDLVNNQHAGFAILSIILTYFEPISQFLEGRSSGSKNQFKRGLIAVFPNAVSIDNSVFNELYEQLRCGMFHQGMTKRKVLISREPNVAPIEVRSFIKQQVDTIIVNPWKLLTESESHFHRYCAELRVSINTEIRTNFETWFDKRGA